MKIKNNNDIHPNEKAIIYESPRQTQIQWEGHKWLGDEQSNLTQKIENT